MMYKFLVAAAPEQASSYCITTDQAASTCDAAVAMSFCFAADVFFSFFIFFQRGISELPRPLAMKLCQMIGNRCNFKT